MPRLQYDDDGNFVGLTSGQVTAPPKPRPAPPEPSEPEPESEDLAEHTVAELRALAEDRGVDLGDATRKADIIEALGG
jgi:hypothetical protein